jgi:hypothetical protein
MRFKLVSIVVLLTTSVMFLTGCDSSVKGRVYERVDVNATDAGSVFIITVFKNYSNLNETPPKGCEPCHLQRYLFGVNLKVGRMFLFVLTPSLRIVMLY